MDQPRLVGPPPRSSTPAGSSLHRSHKRPLPPDLLRQASRRLEVISLLAGSVWIITTVFYHFIDRVYGAGDTRWLSWMPSDVIVGTATALSLGVFIFVRRTTRDPQFILDLGLVYLIATAFLAGLILHWDPYIKTSVDPTISWVGVMVLLCAAALPNDPVKTTIAGLIAVSMNPVGMLIARARGTWPFDSAVEAWTMHYPDFLIVGVSVVVSRVVSGLGQQVAKAREMGSYQLGDLIGRGGMGEVYAATHRMLTRPAAIKLISPQMMAERNGERAEIAIERFHREAQAAAQLRSPHTVGLYDFGTTEDGTLYFAMELLEGMDLESLVRQTGPLPAARVVHILRQVSASLDEAHRSGLVHRDIKPANIHIGRFGLRDDFVKVLDFGLVTSPGPSAHRNPLETAVGVIPGTPAYMAPEMALGEKVDGRADLYALGCVAYYLLTGQMAFAADSGMQSLVKRLHEDPLPPSARTELPIPADLEAIVLACLAREPDNRPRSAAELRRLLAGVTTPRWTEEQARLWWAVHRPQHPSGSARHDASLATASAGTGE